ncbi:MAG: quinone oxidoreductase [Chthoniobacter sp.]|nr:quinone oxidoreductase [Chthoniobacter sp.]
MKTIRVQTFGGPEVLQIEDIPELTPGWDQVVVQLEAIGVNPVDTYIRSGSHSVRPELPYTPGLDGAGVIVELGDGVTQWRRGQRVYLTGSLSGTYAERALCGANHVQPLPERVSFAQGAALGVPYTTAHYALFARGQARPGENVLVHGGTGGVGLATIQIARAAGLRVYATGGSDAGRALAREQGAHAVFDHTASDYRTELLAATAGQGFDVIIEMLANVNLASDLTLLATGGRVVVVGSRGPIEINPRDAMSRNADIRGVMLFTAPPAELNRSRAALQAGLENGTLRPVTGREFPLVAAARAHEAVLSSSASGKIVLIP